jgi:hypothetical protein
MPITQKVKAKHWGKVDKKHLSDLIRKGEVNINNTSHENIKDVQREYFSHRDIKYFCCNFCIFAVSLDLKTEYNSARLRKAGKLQYLHFTLMSIVSHIFPSLILSKIEEEVNHDNKDNADNDTKDAANDNNGDDNNNKDNNTLMLPKEKPVAEQKTAAIKQNKDDKITHLPTSKPLAILTFSVKAANPLTVS